MNTTILRTTGYKDRKDILKIQKNEEKTERYRK
jgi:hypothetical protein